MRIACWEILIHEGCFDPAGLLVGLYKSPSMRSALGCFCPPPHAGVDVHIQMELHTHTHAHTHIWLVELSREKQLNCNAIPYPSCKQNENIALHVCSFHLRSALIFPLSECRGSFSPAGITVLLRSVTGTFYIVLMAKAPQINEGCKFNQLPFCLGVWEWARRLSAHRANCQSH